MPRIARFNPFNRFASWRLAFRGLLDGLAGIPAFAAEAQPPVLKELEEAAAHDGALAAERFTHRDKGLRTRWANAHVAHGHAHQAVTRTFTAYEAARSAFTEANGEAAPATADRRTLAYKVALGVLAVLEFPINAAAFVTLGDGDEAQWALAALAGISLLLCAHVVGMKLRCVRRWSWQEATLTVACVLGPAGVIAAVGYFRRLAAGLYEAPLLQSGIAFDPTAVTAAYVAFNVAAFVSGVALSFWAHPAGWGELLRTRRRHEEARRRAEMADRHLEAARVTRLGTFEATRAHVARIQKIVDLLAERYRQVNLRWRRDRHHAEPYPASFNRPLPLPEPAALSTLDWTLPAGTASLAERPGAPDPSGDGAVATLGVPTA